MIAIIAAVAENGVIGSKEVINGIPWENKEDQKRFLELTRGNPMLMGSKTFEINFNRLGRPFRSGRTTIIITRNKDYKAPEGVLVYNSIDKALEDFKDKNLFIIGGGEIFKETMDKADTMYITHIHRAYEGDAHFPKINMGGWRLESEDAREGFTFTTYRKK